MLQGEVLRASFPAGPGYVGALVTFTADRSSYLAPSTRRWDGYSIEAESTMPGRVLTREAQSSQA